MPSRAQLGQRLARLEQQIVLREQMAQRARAVAAFPPFTPDEKRQVLRTLIGAGWLLCREPNERKMALKLQLLSAIYPEMSAADIMALYEPHAEEATHEPSAEPAEQPVAS